MSEAADDGGAAVDSDAGGPIIASVQMPRAVPRASASRTSDTPSEQTITFAHLDVVRGSVEGGTQVTISGNFPGSAYAVTIGGVACSGVAKPSASMLSCVTPKHALREIDEPVLVQDVVTGELSNAGNFQYFCPWVWRAGQPASCGAAPPAHKVAEENASAMITTFQPGHGFTIGPAAIAPSVDTTSHVFGSQSVVFQTDGAGHSASLGRLMATAIDFTHALPKVWLRLDGGVHAKLIELHLGSSAADFYTFRLEIPANQQWAPDGAWVSPSLPFGSSVVGHPVRSAITLIELVATDDTTGPVTVHVNGLGTVDEPTVQYPKGVLSFTFDDGYAAQATIAEPILTRAGFAGTAYIIQEMIGRPEYLTLGQATALEAAGWDVSAHAFRLAVHNAGYAATGTADVETDIVSTRAWLMENGFRGYDHCAYPHGTFNDDVRGLVSKYFTSCRTIYSSSRESALPSDAEKLRAYVVASTATAQTVTDRIDEAIANHQWLIVLIHNLTPDPPAANHTNDYLAASFQTIVDHAKSSGIAVKPVSQVLSAE